MRWKLTTITVAAGLLLMAATLPARPNGIRVLLLQVQTAGNPYCASRLEEFLTRDLTRNKNVRVALTESIEADGRLMPDDQSHLDSLVSWGSAAHGRYLLQVTIDSERLVRRKRLHIPLVMHQYETVGVIKGELRLIDLVRGRWLISEPFAVEQGGPQSIQAGVYDNDTDPSLNLSAPAKVMFFEKLHEKTCRSIMSRVGEHIGGASNGN